MSTLVIVTGSTGLVGSTFVKMHNSSHYGSDGEKWRLYDVLYLTAKSEDQVMDFELKKAGLTYEANYFELEKYLYIPGTSKLYDNVTIINLAAYTVVDERKFDTMIANNLNFHLPKYFHELSCKYPQIKMNVIHVSTNYVKVTLEGTNVPTTRYAISKKAGDNYISKINNSIIIYTSNIYDERNNKYDKLNNLVCNMLIQPTKVDDLSRLLMVLIFQSQRNDSYNKIEQMEFYSVDATTPYMFSKNPDKNIIDVYDLREEHETNYPDAALLDRKIFYDHFTKNEIMYILGI